MLSKCRVLALETATDVAGIAIVELPCTQRGTWAEFIISNSRKNGERIMALIDRLLKDVNLELKDIDLLAAGIGPGLYTGIRCGLAIMKGLSIAAQKPLVGISTLDTIACNFSGSKEKIVTLLNAYGGEVYGAVYEAEAIPAAQECGVNLKRCGNYFVGPIEGFFKKINLVGKSSNRVGSKVIFAGAGVKIYQEKIEEALGKKAVFASKESWIPRPGSLARLAVRRYRKGHLPHPERILPLYLKKFPSSL